VCLCVGVCVCGSVTTITRNCVHRSCLCLSERFFHFPFSMTTSHFHHEQVILTDWGEMCLPVYSLLPHVPATRRSTIGDRTFAVAGPRAWNNLPVNLRLSRTFTIFKTHLKSHLFNLSFPSV